MLLVVLLEEVANDHRVWRNIESIENMKSPCFGQSQVDEEKETNEQAKLWSLWQTDAQFGRWSEFSEQKQEQSR